MNRRFLALALVAVGAAGCNSGYKIVPVSGRVTLDGHPVANAEVSFYSTDVKDAPYASGKTDEQGNYKLETFEGRSTSNGGSLP